MIFAKRSFLTLLARGKEDFFFGADGHTQWVMTFPSTALSEYANALGFADLHDAITKANALADEKNILDRSK